MPKKQSSSNAVDEVMALALKVTTAKPGDTVFIQPGRPLDTKAMQHITAKFKAANLGVKVVVLQHHVAVVDVQSPPNESDRIAEENAG